MNGASSAPRLAPPGAGIPAVERVIGGTVFALLRRVRSRHGWAAAFVRERGVIAGLCSTCDERSRGVRVLIPRLRGLEDSSRFWSVHMTLDHLRIVNQQITGVIRALVRGEVPGGAASTAAVKPSAEVGPGVVRAYEEACQEFLDFTASCPSLDTRERYAHPWFGPLSAAGWHAMAGWHMRIHRNQIGRILRGLAGGAS